ncbi:hypothetical protein Tco_0796087 [Tanacetum coccineum]
MAKMCLYLSFMCAGMIPSGLDAAMVVKSGLELRFQVTPKTSHLLAIKRIFRYVKDKPTLGLWYSRDSPFDLCKEANFVLPPSTTKAEYVLLTICIIENPVQHSKTKHIEIRHHFIRDCNAKKLIQMVKIHTDHNVADLLTKGFDAGSKGSERLSHKELGDKMERAATTASSLEAE